MSKKKKKNRTSSFASSSSFCHRPWMPALQGKRVNLHSCEQLKGSQFLKALDHAGACHWRGQHRKMGPRVNALGTPSPRGPVTSSEGSLHPRDSRSQQPGQARALWPCLGLTLQSISTWAWLPPREMVLKAAASRAQSIGFRGKGLMSGFLEKYFRLMNETNSSTLRRTLSSLMIYLHAHTHFLPGVGSKCPWVRKRTEVIIQLWSKLLCYSVPSENDF